MGHGHGHVRHYPLDLPSGLPFDRYEHRRLTARDILVHRILSKLFSAAPELVPVLDARRAAGEPNAGGRFPYHNFGPLRRPDAGLARDVQVLRKMLVTRSATEWVTQDFIKPVKLSCSRRCYGCYRCQPPQHILVPPAGPAGRPPTIEEEILDLVRRHYMETDDAPTRLWLQSLQPPQPSSYATLQGKTAKNGTHVKLVQHRKKVEEREAAEDSKRWYDEDTAHLKALQDQTRVSNESRLYEGGAFLPALRTPLARSRAARKHFREKLSDSYGKSFFATEHKAQAIMDEVYPWPEPHAPRRILHVPSWYSWRQKQDQFRRQAPLVDFASGRTGRGLDRDGIWSTGRWFGDDVPRGRSVRRGRRRATSEPPPGLFTAARLPYGFNATRELLLFPKTSTLAMDRRARRRSLSRTRVAEMFNWDVVVEKPRTKPRVKKNFEVYLQPPSKLTSVLPKHSQGHSDLYYKHIRKTASIYRALWTGSVAPRWLVSASVTSVVEEREPRTVIGEGAGRMRLEHEIDWEDARSLEAIASIPFTSPPFPGFARKPPAIVPCANCNSTTHLTADCVMSCGHCGAPNPDMEDKYKNLDRFSQLARKSDDAPSKAGQHDHRHLAPDCPVSRNNRCKCGPFPAYHVAAKCSVPCSRDCGNPHPPGHFKHRNAMGCKSRCCMCGMRGHSGTQCKLRRCRCGGEHLGQDCCFHPECRVKGCDRFLCGVHCLSCGVDRARLEEGVGFVGRRCPACSDAAGLAPPPSATPDATEMSRTASEGRPGPSRPGSDGTAGPAERRTRKNKRKHRPPPGTVREKEEKPWYAPLEQRTRPVVSSKSGKNAGGRWAKADMVPAVRIGGCR